MDLSDLVRELQGRYQNATFDATQPCQNCARSARLVEVIDDAANLLSVIPPDKLSGLQTIIQVYLDSNDRFAFKLEENAGRYNNGPQDYFHNHYHETINYVHIEGNTASYNELKNETSCSVCEILLDVLSGRSLKPLSGIDDWLINLCFCNEKGWFLRGIENHQIEATQQEGKITTNILRDTKLVPVLPLTSRLTFELDEKFVDKSRIIRWIDGCDKKHAGSCHSITDPWLQFEHPTEFLLLDVQRLCLSHQSKPCKYVALSYLWGEQDNIVQTTTSTAAQLFKADAFHRDCIDLPETIRNSIDFVASIGQKFLWIDRFCITQDDEIHKSSQINTMAAIYANSYFTIIAYDGSDDTYGLRCLPECSIRRQPPWKSLSFGPACKFACIERNHSKGERLRVKYETRGWTLQEYELSRRKLIFQNDTVRWRCFKAEFQEQMEHDIGLSTSCFLSRSHGPTFWWYRNMVQEYSHRELSYPEDILDAFSAIVTAASRSLPGGILFGIPELFFDGCLLWEPYVSYSDPSSSFKRRQDGSGAPLKGVPSWSWAGWSGELRLGNWFWLYTFSDDVDDSDRLPWYEFHPINEWYKTRHGQAQIRERVCSGYISDTGMCDGTQSPSPREHTYVSIKPAAQPLPVTHNIWSPVLSVATERLTLSVGEIIDEKELPGWFEYMNHATKGILLPSISSTILDAVGSIVGTLQLTSKNVPCRKSCELICISKGVMDFTVKDHGGTNRPRNFPEFHILHKDCPAPLCDPAADHDGCVVDPTLNLLRFYHVL